MIECLLDLIRDYVQFSAVYPYYTLRMSSFFSLVMCLRRCALKYHAKPETTEARMRAVGPRLTDPLLKMLVVCEAIGDS